MESVRIRKATNEDKNNVYSIVKTVGFSMENPDWFCVETPQKFYDDMIDQKLSYVVENEAGRLVAAFLVNTDFGYLKSIYSELGYNDRMLKKCIDFDTAVVMQNYRGRHLQLQLGKVLIGNMPRKFKYALCTVHPDNL